MSPPASLPSFRKLARIIGEPLLPLPAKRDAPLDVYLGKVERASVDVQSRARDALRVPDGAHTPLHEHLLGIFGRHDAVRLITTNFDSHFSAAFNKRFPGAPLQHYAGPALPPGHDFHGIAQLHGSLDRADRLVLTDADFANAYMAEGWASRFLVRVFSARTVLFVGYSVSDPLMRYLLQAIPPTGRWFALWHESDTPSDDDYPIRAITFRENSEGNQYADLNDGIARWDWYVNALPSEHETELRRLITIGPPESPLDRDYVRARLDAESGAELFRRTATDIGWFDWAVGEGILNGLTDQLNRDSDTPNWGRWSLDHFCDGDRPPLLGFLRGRPVLLQPRFAAEIVHHLWVRKPSPSRSIVRQFTALIVSQPDSVLGTLHGLNYLIERLLAAEFHEEALALLRAATRLRLLPLETLYLTSFIQEHGEPDEPHAFSNRVGTCLSPVEIESILDRHGASLALTLADDLLQLGEQRILEAYELLEMARSSSDAFDWLSHGRTSIAPSNQDNLSRTEDVLVLMVRMVLDTWAVSSADRLKSFAMRHERSTRTLLRRLALYAYAKCSSGDSVQILDHALELGWAKDYRIRPELYQVLASHFARVDEIARVRFIDAIRDDGWWGEHLDDHTDRVRFNLAHKLLRAAPQSAVVAAFRNEEEAAHPEWAEGDVDGFLSRMEIVYSGQEPSPIAADEMMGWEASDVLTRLRASLAEETVAGLGDSLLGAIQQAVRTAPDWGVELFKASMTGDAMSFRIADAILWALRDQALLAPSQLRLLRLFLDGEWDHSHLNAIASLLDHWSGAVGTRPDVELLDALDQGADLVYKLAQVDEPIDMGFGWTETAINHPAGHAATVWWNIANARDWVDGKFVLTLDEREKERWALVIGDASAAGACARPILGMATERLSAGDYPWSDEVVFPSFDASLRSDQSAQLWDGRMMQQRWSRTTVEGLHPYLDSLFSTSAVLIPERSTQLGDWVAMLVTRPDSFVFTLELLQRFVQYASDEARRAFARNIPQHLSRLDPEAREFVWHKMLSPYWKDRSTRMPLPLAAEEVAEMVSWVPALPEAMEEALERLEASPGERLERAGLVLFEWGAEPDWVQRHPNEAVRLLQFLANRHAIENVLTDNAVRILERALSSGASPTLVRRAAETIVEMGSSSASDLLRRLRPPE